jgi:hypothetical protein
MKRPFCRSFFAGLLFAGYAIQIGGRTAAADLTMVRFNFESRAAQRGLLKCPLYAPRGFSVGLRGATVSAPQNIKLLSLTI